MELAKSLGQEFKHAYVRLIACGHVESSALKLLEVDWLDFFELCAKDPEFRLDIENARKSRADRWIDRVIESAEDRFLDVEDPKTKEIKKVLYVPSKDETSHRKLQFEKMKFLAQADNPEKYGVTAGKAKVNIAVDLSDFKLLTPQESIKVLNNDPFNKMVTIDAEVLDAKEKE